MWLLALCDFFGREMHHLNMRPPPSCAENEKARAKGQHMMLRELNVKKDDLDLEDGRTLHDA